MQLTTDDVAQWFTVYVKTADLRSAKARTISPFVKHSNDWLFPDGVASSKASMLCSIIVAYAPPYMGVW